ncbi:hypothetical protein N7532_001912 [Penicillium argentinense]|uniref:Beta-lactamase-related domain-containing protein n=1 Tax=Penicillium argentinense TaxID=1131581 RepID=A0A9W9KMY0_9EURO|nr:uncharacterized protein N7532_001912 [Penicillium argentinense]KAJ5111377.1 hypothetical protein N7532_001912 [Penicillium argentinense]
MEEIGHILDQFTDSSTGSLHGAVFVVVDSSGTVIYDRTSGKASFDEANPRAPQLDSLCWVASMTKLVTAVALMQLVERGTLSLDDDARDYVPELKDIQILQDIGSEKDTPSSTSPPNLVPVRGKITIRDLLCHTAGFVYDSSSPLLQKWSKLHGRTAHTFCGSIAGYTHPLIFEPGTSWAYGAGLDWAGRVVECVSKSSLEDYMKTNIWSKIGAISTTFHPELNRGTLPMPLEMGYRVGVGQGSKSVKAGRIILDQPAKDELGGIGLFSTPSDFVKLLTALLRGGGPLLSQKGVDTLFRPQLSEASRVAMPRPLGLQMRKVLGINDIADIKQADHSLGGTITLRDIPGRRRAGTVNWSGLPNLHWWIDRKAGIAAALFTQLMPPGDAAVTSLLIDLEKAVYKSLDTLIKSSVTGAKL